MHDDTSHSQKLLRLATLIESGDKVTFFENNPTLEELTTILKIDKPPHISLMRLILRKRPTWIDELYQKIIIPCSNDGTKKRRPGDGIRLLYYAVLCKQHAEVQKILRSSKTGVNRSYGKYLALLLYVAAYYGYVEIARTLRENGADVNRGGEKCSVGPLWVAAQNGHDKVVCLLLQGRPKVDAPRAKDGATPLYIAAQKGHLAVVKLLLNAGADAFAVIKYKYKTPFWIAAANGHVDIVRYFLENRPAAQILHRPQLEKFERYPAVLGLLLRNRSRFHPLISSQETENRCVKALDEGNVGIAKVYLDELFASDSPCTSYAIVRILESALLIKNEKLSAFILEHPHITIEPTVLRSPDAIFEIARTSMKRQPQGFQLLKEWFVAESVDDSCKMNCLKMICNALSNEKPPHRIYYYELLDLIFCSVESSLFWQLLDRFIGSFNIVAGVIFSDESSAITREEARKLDKLVAAYYWMGRQQINNIKLTVPKESLPVVPRSYFKKKLAILLKDKPPTYLLIFLLDLYIKFRNSENPSGFPSFFSHSFGKDSKLAAAEALREALRVGQVISDESLRLHLVPLSEGLLGKIYDAAKLLPPRTMVPSTSTAGSQAIEIHEAGAGAGAAVASTTGSDVTGYPHTDPIPVVRSYDIR